MLCGSFLRNSAGQCRKARENDMTLVAADSYLKWERVVALEREGGWCEGAIAHKGVGRNKKVEAGQ